MIRSAAYRIAAVTSAAFAAAVLLIGLGVYWSADRGLRRERDGRIAAEVSSLVSEYRGEGLGGLEMVIRRRETARATNDLGYGLWDRSGARVAGLLDAPVPPRGWQDVPFRETSGPDDGARALVVDIGAGYRLAVAADGRGLVSTEKVILSIFATAFAAVAALGAAGAWLLGTYLRGRLSRIGDAADRIAAGDLAARAPVGPRGDEFDRVAAALNAMLDRIGELLDNLRQVSSDVAHDLRTPLARLRGRLEEGRRATDKDRVLADAITSLDETLALFTAILRVSEIEAGGLRASFGDVDLSGLASDLAESFQPAFEDGGRSLRFSIDPDVHVLGDRELIAQAVTNLLDNAQVHTEAGAVAEVRLTATPSSATLIVTDDGPGVPVEDRERVTRRFVRLERDRGRPGHGLGLSLVAAIARIHGADLRLEGGAPGLRVVLKFPR